MSPDPENEYFADGISEELLDVLSDVDGLKVASRTSSFAFKGKDVNIGEVARTLGVAHVLEGSVRKQGRRVRITAQLIDTGSDQHLWSETYDRQLDDIFAVQEEIARSIAGALSGPMGLAVGASKVEVAQATGDLQAYEAYLRGRQLFHQRGAGLVDARRLLEDAVERDPAFAPAWAILSAVYGTMASYGALDETDSDILARRAAERARELDDTLGLPYAVLGQSAAEGGRPLEGLEMFDRAIERDPADSTPHLWRGLLHLAVGHLAAAEADFKRAVEMDPLSAINHGWYGAVLGMRGKRAEGDALLERAQKLGWASAGFLQGPFALADGDRASAERDLAGTLERLTDPGPETQATFDAMLAATGGSGPQRPLRRRRAQAPRAIPRPDLAGRAWAARRGDRDLARAGRDGQRIALPLGMDAHRARRAVQAGFPAPGAARRLDRLLGGQGLPGRLPHRRDARAPPRLRWGRPMNFGLHRPCRSAPCARPQARRQRLRAMPRSRTRCAPTGARCIPDLSMIPESVR